MTVAIVTRKEELRKQRAEIIVGELKTRITNSTGHMLKVGKLLTEFKNRRMYTCFDCSSMTQWLSESNIGFAVSVATRLMTVTERAHLLDIPPDEIEKIGIVKLEAIFRLEPKRHAEKISGLLEAAPKMNLNDIKAEVGESFKRKTLKKWRLSFEVTEEIFDRVAEIRAGSRCSTFDALKEYLNA